MEITLNKKDFYNLIIKLVPLNIKNFSLYSKYFLCAPRAILSELSYLPEFTKTVHQSDYLALSYVGEPISVIFYAIEYYGKPLYHPSIEMLKHDCNQYKLIIIT